MIEIVKQNKDINIAELAVEMDKYFIDCKPNNIRWQSDDSTFSEGILYNLFFVFN